MVLHPIYIRNTKETCSWSLATRAWTTMAQEATKLYTRTGTPAQLLSSNLILLKIRLHVSSLEKAHSFSSTPPAAVAPPCHRSSPPTAGAHIHTRPHGMYTSDESRRRVLTGGRAGRSSGNRTQEPYWEQTKRSRAAVNRIIKLSNISRIDAEHTTNVVATRDQEA